MDYFSVKNWDKYQHYKDRNPPWIKLHKDLLHDYEFTCLQDASKLQLMMIWLLASQMDNKIPADPKWLRDTLHLSSDIDLKPLSDGGFIKIDSNVLADCKQSAMPEAEAEAEAEADIKSDSIEPDEFDIFWNGYLRKEGKKSAMSAFRQLSKTKKAKAITDSVKRYANTEKRFIPLPASYINGERWEDETGKEAYKGKEI